MKLPTRKALLQRNVAKQRLLDGVATVKPLLGSQGDVARRSVPPTPIPRVTQPMAPIDPARPKRAVQQPPRVVAPRRREPISASQNARTTSRHRLPQQPAIKRLAQARRLNPLRRSRQARVSSETIDKNFNVPYGDFARLHSVFQDDVTLVAIDTESERHGLLSRVVEVGISTLQPQRVLSSIGEGAHVDDWISYMEHSHIVVDDTIYPEERMKKSLFGSSMLMSATQAHERVLDILRSVGPHKSKRRIAFVGHSLSCDLLALRRSSNMRLDLLESHSMDFDHVDSFDTCNLGYRLRKAGATLPSLSLSGLAKAIGINRKYLDGGNLRGWHNASNDAAYTMMVLLLFLARADDKGESANIRPIKTAASRSWRERIRASLKRWIGV